MADAVTSQTVQDGGKFAVLKFTNLSDSTGETAVKKVDVSALEADPVSGKACTGVSIYSITHTCAGMGVQILWDATANVLALELPFDTSDTLDYEALGGLVNNSGAGKTGDVLFTTTGTEASGDSYSVTMKVRKSYG